MSTKLLIEKPHDIIFRCTGEISLCKSLTDTLGIKEGDYVNFMQDGCEFMICKAQWGARLRKAHSGSGYLRCNSTLITEKVIPKGEKSVAYRTGDNVVKDGTTYVYILTRQPCTRKKE
jgi:hypothetical protein